VVVYFYRNLLSGNANQFTLYDDIPLFWDAWDVMDYHQVKVYLIYLCYLFLLKYRVAPPLLLLRSGWKNTVCSLAVENFTDVKK